MKYLLIGLAMLGGTAALWMFATRQMAPPPPPPPPPKSAERVNPMAQPDLELDEPKVPDAGQPPTEAAPVKHVSAGHHVGDWECSGDLPTARKVIDDNRAQIRSCYERRLKVNNVLQGDVKLKLKVGSNGRVVATSVGGTIHDEAVFACVRNLASTWAFSVPSGGACAVVQVPFQFSPKVD
jgi:hypothetical protein